MTVLRWIAVPAALTFAVLVPGTAAVAAEPDRAGWWNRASGGGLVAPAPGATPGDLRVSALSPAEPIAYAAVLFTAPGSSSATLDLKVRGATGTPEIAACRTASVDWPEGENQSYDTAPPYDCALGSAFGSLSEDGTTLSFVLDATTQTESGVWSLALVPQPDSTSGPFVLDLVEPDASVFVADPPESSADASTDDATDPSDDSGTSGQDGGGQAFLPDAFAAPPVFDGGTGQAPLVAAGAEVPLPSAGAVPEPLTAGAAPATAPLLLARPAGVVQDVGSGRRLLALLVLAGGSAAVGYAAGQQRPGPRLIGGRSRAAVPTAAPAPAGPGPGQERPRGIGRFAKARDAAPRRLR